MDELSRVDRGDILVFLSGEREIRETAETLRKHKLQLTEVLPLYARLGPSEQGRIFRPAARVVLCWPPMWQRPPSPYPASAM